MASAASKKGFANAVVAAGWECWAIVWNPDMNQYDYSFGDMEDQRIIIGSSKNYGGCISAAVSRANNNPKSKVKPDGGKP